MIKMHFEEPKLEVIPVDKNDVITTSNYPHDPDDGGTDTAEFGV